MIRLNLDTFVYRKEIVGSGNSYDSGRNKHLELFCYNNKTKKSELIYQMSFSDVYNIFHQNTPTKISFK